MNTAIEITARTIGWENHDLPGFLTGGRTAALATALIPLPSPISSHLLLAGLERLHRLLVHRAHRLFHQLAEARAGEDAVVARVRDVDLQDLLRPARTRGHDRHAMAEKDRLFEVVGDEEDRHLVLVVDLEQRLVHD